MFLGLKSGLNIDINYLLTYLECLFGYVYSKRNG